MEINTKVFDRVVLFYNPRFSTPLSTSELTSQRRLCRHFIELLHRIEIPNAGPFIVDWKKVFFGANTSVPCYQKLRNSFDGAMYVLTTIELAQSDVPICFHEEDISLMRRVINLEFPF